MVKVSKFDVIEYLDSEEMVAEYLTTAKEDGNPDVFHAALADAAKARERIRQLATDEKPGKNFSR